MLIPVSFNYSGHEWLLTSRKKVLLSVFPAFICVQYIYSFNSPAMIMCWISLASMLAASDPALGSGFKLNP